MKITTVYEDIKDRRQFNKTIKDLQLYGFLNGGDLPVIQIINNDSVIVIESFVDGEKILKNRKIFKKGETIIKSTIDRERLHII